MNELDRRYPLEAERAVLGACIINPKHLVEVVTILSADEFGRHAHQRIYRALLELDAAHDAIDLITLKDALARRGDLEEVGGPLYVAGLIDGVPRATNAPHYAAKVKEGARLRRLHALGSRLMTETSEAGGANSAEIIEMGEGEFGRLQAEAPSGWHSGVDLARELYGVIETIQAARGQLRGRASGFADLDRLTNGFQRGDLILLGARPSMGKSALAAQVAWRVAAEAPVALLTLEMERTAVALRMVIGDARLDSWRVLSGYPSSDQLRSLAHSLEALGERKLFVDDTAFMSPLHARAKLRQLDARVGPLGLVVVDYLQLMAPMPDQRRENSATQVAGISRMLKGIARELKVPMLVLSQLNRNVEQTADKRPRMSDLRDSGALEQDADLVLLLHRPAYYLPADDPERAKVEGIAYLDLAKHRNGPVGEIPLAWVEHQVSFFNLARPEVASR